MPARDDDREKLDQTQLDFISWRVDPERVGTQKDWLAERDLTKQVITKWRNSPIFNRVYDEELKKLGVTQERIQDVLDALYYKATVKGDTQAMKQFLDWSKLLMPPRAAEADASELSDIELAEQLERAAFEARERANAITI